MSKAEDKALEKYPYKEGYDVELPYPSTYDENKEQRESFIKGYHQAEKDLELTWEDIMAIDDLLDELLPPRHNSDELVLKGYYEEVLKRFNERKKK